MVEGGLGVLRSWSCGVMFRVMGWMMGMKFLWDNITYICACIIK